jgi:hypothetical protein
MVIHILEASIDTMIVVGHRRRQKWHAACTQTWIRSNHESDPLNLANNSTRPHQIIKKQRTYCASGIMRSLNRASVHACSFNNYREQQQQVE